MDILHQIDELQEKIDILEHEIVSAKEAGSFHSSVVKEVETLKKSYEADRSKFDAERFVFDRERNRFEEERKKFEALRSRLEGKLKETEEELSSIKSEKTQMEEKLAQMKRKEAVLQDIPTWRPRTQSKRKKANEKTEPNAPVQLFFSFPDEG